MGPLFALTFVASVPALVVACSMVAGIDELEVGACKGAKDSKRCFSDEPRPPGSSSGTTPPPGTGTSTSTSGSPDGDTDPPDSAPPPEPFACPTDTKGAPMVLAGTPSNPFCIDKTETSVAQYREFLNSAPSTSSQPAECAWNKTFEPGGSPSPDDLPQVNIDWCDARAYCEWAGKRLCGKVLDGKAAGAVSESEINSANVDQWYIACSAAGSQTYPYGDTMKSQACNFMSADGGGQGARSDSGSTKGCVGGYDGVFDMLGNVWEWTDDCFVGSTSDAADPKTWFCPGRGGSYDMLEGDVTCRTTGLWSARQAAGGQTGMRCCSK